MRNSDGRIVIGVILVAIGLFLVYDNLFNFHFFFLDYLFSFPAILIFIGIVILLNSRNNFIGYLLLIGGAYFFMRDFLHLEVNHIIGDIWPLLIIGFGLYILLKKRNGLSSNYNIDGSTGKDGKNDFDTNKMDFIDEITILGGSKKAFSSQQFRGGKITTIFAGSEIDLRDCKLAGERQIIDILTLFGSTEIYLPRDWKVVISVVSIFGGFDDDRRIDIEDEKVLVIKGLVLFGANEIKS